MNEIVTIGGIDCYEENGTAYLNLEAVARGLGFTTTQVVKGTEYTNVRWNRVDEYLEEIGFATSGKRPEYIPENIFYRLAMKAKNETAEKFQAFVADEVIPSIRKHGAYMTPKTLQEMLDDPGAMIEVLQRLREERERRKELETVVSVKDQQIAEMTPKAGYYDRMDPIAQTITNLSEPTKELQRRLLRRELDLMGNPVLRWMFRNVAIYTDPNLNIRLNKAKSTEKIDGCAASVNAVAGYLSATARNRVAYADGADVKVL